MADSFWPSEGKTNHEYAQSGLTRTFLSWRPCFWNQRLNLDLGWGAAGNTKTSEHT